MSTVSIFDVDTLCISNTSGPMAAVDIFRHPEFPEVDRQLAGNLIEIHREAPRLARLKASHRKWLMTQALYALSMQRIPGDPTSGLNGSRFIEIATSIGAASKNTADAYLKELLAYKFLREVPFSQDKRIRVLETTESSDSAMLRWFMGHMRGLDCMDGGNRVAACLEHPQIFRHAQPRAAGALMANPLWRHPAESINHFLSSEFGGMIIHEFMFEIKDFTAVDGRVVVGPVTIPSLAEQYGSSSTNIKRMFKRAQDDGLLGWEGRRGHKILWLSQRFIDDYLWWQAQKFAALDEAFHFSYALMDMEGVRG